MIVLTSGTVVELPLADVIAKMWNVSTWWFISLCVCVCVCVCVCTCMCVCMCVCVCK